jgi:multidrug resistance efflux pump
VDNEYNDTAADETAEQPRGLRAQLEAVLAEKKALQEEVANLKGTVRSRQVADILSAKGVSPKVANLIPSNVEGEEAVSKWLEDFSDVFGIKSGEAQADATAQAAAVAASPEAAATQRLQDLNNTGTTQPKLADIEARMREAKTPEELNALMAEAQKFVL